MKVASRVTMIAAVAVTGLVAAGARSPSAIFKV